MRMAFQVRDLMVTLEPSRHACPTASADTQCPTASATLPWQLTCGPISADTQCPTASAEQEVVEEPLQNLRLLRQQLSARLN
jgi:hypothetical protein